MARLQGHSLSLKDSQAARVSAHHPPHAMHHTQSADTAHSDDIFKGDDEQDGEHGGAALPVPPAALPLCPRLTSRA